MPTFSGIFKALLVGLLLLAAAGCGGPIEAPGPAISSRYVYIEPEVAISHIPELYDPFTVTGKATALRQDLVDAELWLNVSGAVYLEGEDRWHGPLKQGEAKIISATFAFVTEGNQEVATSAFPDPELDLVQPGLRSPGINLHVSETDTSQGLKVDPLLQAYSWSPGDPNVVAGGHLVLADTALQLNHSSSPRIEIIDGPEDLSTLQSQGLVPQNFRYEWRFLNLETVVDFSQQFFIAFYDTARPVPGKLILMEDKGVGTIVWDDGVLKADLETHAIPVQESQAKKQVSSVSVYGFGRADTPDGLPDTKAFQGTRTFEFSIDGAGPVQITRELQSVSSESVP